MPKVLQRPATYEDLLKVPEHLVAELVDGELFASPRPAPRHVNAASVLGGELNQRFQRGDGGPGGWWIYDEPELHLSHDVLVPDIAGWRRERMPDLPETAYFEIAPDWICEIVSPNTSRLDRLKKLPRYARYEVDYAWIVDPLIKGLEIYRRAGEHFVLLETHEGATRVRAVPFEEAEIDLGAVWA
jgi:Uma2 family endonuclease